MRSRRETSRRLSSPTSLEIAAAASARRIKLGATVSVLSTDEPIRLFQQLAAAAAIAPGRIEVVAGRGSSAITFSMFDLDERDYDRATYLAHERRMLESGSAEIARPSQPNCQNCEY